MGYPPVEVHVCWKELRQLGRSVQVIAAVSIAHCGALLAPAEREGAWDSRLPVASVVVIAPKAGICFKSFGTVVAFAQRLSFQP